MKTEIIWLTPEKAQELLKTNTINRVVIQARVEYLAGLMRAGHWKLTHQGIAIDKNGVFIDGQHRLLACISSGVTIKIMLTTGLEPESFEAIDLHAKRGVHDVLRINKRAVSVINLLYTTFKGVKTPSPQQVNEYYHKLQRDVDNILSNTENTKVFGNAAFMLAALLQCMNGNGDYAIKSLYKLSHSALQDLNPIQNHTMKLRISGQFVKSTGSATAFSRDVLLKAFYVLDPLNADKQHIRFHQDVLMEKLKAIVTNSIVLQ